MIGAIEVDLVGESAWSVLLPFLSAFLGAILIAGAAVFAARTARESAFERQEEQLTHDTQRQKEALAHDREMRDRESTRLVLEGAMETINGVMRFFSDWTVHISFLQEVIDDPAKQADAMQRMKEVSDDMAEATTQLAQLGFGHLRIASRPDAGDVALAYEDIQLHYSQFSNALMPGLTEKFTSEQLDVVQRMESEIGTKVGALLATWWQWLHE
jgi:hypothetical protein